MMTILLTGCYLLVALVPAVLPGRLIWRLKPIFPGLAAVPPLLTLLALALAQPLTDWLGDAVAIVAVILSSASLATGVVGIKLIRVAAQEGETRMGLALLTILAGSPFLVLILAALSGWVTGMLAGRLPA